LADIVSKEVRSRMMAGIGPANTKPELLLRRALHALGWRYRLHDRHLRGKPDLVFPGRRAVIFVNGCFWHGHACHLFRWPSTRPEFWEAKIGGNIARDSRVRASLGEAGWRVADVWECTLKGRERLPLEEVVRQCVDFLEGDAGYLSVGSANTVSPSMGELHQKEGR
jgi:DNA mismatch endonuclease, patch repair protein